MMQHEFEALAGYEVSTEDYNNIIEPMYMAVSMDKAEFVKTINKKRFALKPAKSIVKEMKAVAEHLKVTCNHYTDFEARERLESLVNEYIKRKGYNHFAGYYIETQYTYGGCRGCTYPRKAVIYGLKQFNTIEIIELA